MKMLLMRLCKDECGAETAEWVLVVAMILVVSVAIYTGMMQDTLDGLVDSIGNQIAGIF